MSICASTYCIHNKKRNCTLENIRLDRVGICEQCCFENDFDVVELTREVGKTLIAHKQKKALRRGSTM